MPAFAQSGEPIKIGFSMALTGPLAANGKQALLGAKIGQEEINAKGGLLGRQVKLINYDDQSNPANVPGIYTKLLDVDKVDLVVSGYATNMVAPAIPVVMQKQQDLHRLVRARCEQRIPLSEILLDAAVRPDTERILHRGFLPGGGGAKSEAENHRDRGRGRRVLAQRREGARNNVKKYGFNIVYDKTYPPNTTDFSPIIRAIQAANPDLVVICSYPLSSVGMMLSANELGFKPKMMGGAMVGLQATVFKDKLKSKLNGIVNYETWVPSPKLMAPAADFFKKYQDRAQGRRRRSARLLPRRLGLCLFPGAATGRRGRQEHQRRQDRRLPAQP